MKPDVSILLYVAAATQALALPIGGQGMKIRTVQDLSLSSTGGSQTFPMHVSKRNPTEPEGSKNPGKQPESNPAPGGSSRPASPSTPKSLHDPPAGQVAPPSPGGPGSSSNPKWGGLTYDPRYGDPADGWGNKKIIQATVPQNWEYGTLPAEYHKPPPLSGYRPIRSKGPPLDPSLKYHPALQWPPGQGPPPEGGPSTGPAGEQSGHPGQRPSTPEPGHGHEDTSQQTTPKAQKHPAGPDPDHEHSDGSQHPTPKATKRPASSSPDSDKAGNSGESSSAAPPKKKGKESERRDLTLSLGRRSPPRIVVEDDKGNKHEVQVGTDGHSPDNQATENAQGSHEKAQAAEKQHEEMNEQMSNLLISKSKHSSKTTKRDPSAGTDPTVSHVLLSGVKKTAKVAAVGAAVVPGGEVAVAGLTLGSEAVKAGSGMYQHHNEVKAAKATAQYTEHRMSTVASRA
ncbi:hypothetical protein ANO11243_090340 [Dothideomycetidae sp. 11243]|nr:hypothetical protein ANO11243_090340 [fungal sp. No.11243]